MIEENVTAIFAKRTFASACGVGNQRWQSSDKPRPISAEDAAEFRAIQKPYQSSLTVVTGDAKNFALFKSFVGDRVNNPYYMLPQTLILTEQNVVATRINGPVDSRNTLPIEDAVDAVLDGKGN